MKKRTWGKNASKKEIAMRKSPDERQEGKDGKDGKMQLTLLSGAKDRRRGGEVDCIRQDNGLSCSPKVLSHQQC